MRLSFIYPSALLLLLLVPLLIGLTLASRKAQSIRSPVRFWSLLTLRTIVMVGLILALAGTQLVRPVTDQTVVFLIDQSDSVAPTQRDQAIGIINEALKAKRNEDQAAIVVFGENALVERAPSALNELARLTSTPIGVRTNIAEAIQLGLALLPNDRQKRIVLLSDGGENNGNAGEAARIAAARNIPIDVIPLLSELGDDVLITGLSAPDSARVNQEVQLQATFRSTIATQGQLQVFADNELISTQQVTIPEGNSSLALTMPGGESGFHRYEIRLDAEGDTQPINNRAATFTNIQGPPKILIATSDTSEAKPLQDAINNAGANAEVVAPGQIPANQALLSQYDAIILLNVLSRDVPRAVQEALPRYVRDLGRGLAMIGGDQSFGAGGWRRSPLTEALPVELDPLDTSMQPNVGLVMVIDRSGSMSDLAGGVTKLDLAKEAVYQASLGLRNNDEIGVVAFDDGAMWALPIQPLPSAADLERGLSTISLGGGTNIRSGIEPAAESLALLNSSVRHVIVLTDGYADSNYADLIEEMRANQTTISIVAIGEEANPALQEIAELGGGRYYRVQNLGEVPNIFLNETVIVAGRDIIDQSFTPIVALPAVIVRTLDGMPPLHGYNATEQRPAARTILVTPDGKPVLAQWQYGLGRSVAWTSDFKGQWGRDWITWGQFPRFVNGLLDLLLPPPQTQGLALEAYTIAGSTRAALELSALDDLGQPLDQLQLVGRVLDPGQQGIDLNFSQIGPGRYRAEITAANPGVYLAQVVVQNADGEALGSASNGLVVSYSPEYSGQRDNPTLLADLAAISSGRNNPDRLALFEPIAQPVGVVRDIGLNMLWLALLLWPLDIALRRLRLGKRELQALKPSFSKPSSQQSVEPDPTLARLRAAKASANQRYSAPSANEQQTSVSPAVQEQTPAVQDRRQSPSQPPVEPAPRSSGPEADAPNDEDDSMARLLAAKRRARKR
jgi:Mg-chelatase subunit ChlD